MSDNASEFGSPREADPSIFNLAGLEPYLTDKVHLTRSALR